MGKITNKAWCFISLVILLSASLIACNDQSSSNSSDRDDEESSNVNTSRVIQTPDGLVTVRPDPNDENARLVESGTSNIRLDCVPGNNITFFAGDSEVDVCSVEFD